MNDRRVLQDITNNGFSSSAPERKSILKKPIPAKQQMIRKPEEANNSVDQSLLDDLNHLNLTKATEESEIGENTIQDFWQQLEMLTQKNQEIAHAYENERLKNKKLLTQNMEDARKIQELTDLCEEFKNSLDKVTNTLKVHETREKKEEVEKKNLLQQVTSLTEKLNHTTTKAKLLEGEKKKLEETLKAKPKEKVVPEIKRDHRDQKIEELTKLIEKEKDTRLALEKKLLNSEGKMELMLEKIEGAEEEVLSYKRLLVVLEEKLKASNQQKEMLSDRVANEERRSSKDEKELNLMREEMSKICEKALAEKQRAEELDKELDDVRRSNEKLRATMSKLEDSERSLIAEVTEKDALLKKESAELRALSEKYEKLQAESLKDMEELQKVILSQKKQLETITEEEKELKAQNDAMQRKCTAFMDRLRKEEGTKQQMREELEHKEAELADAVEKRNVLQKRGEKDAKTMKKLADDLKKAEDTAKQYKSRAEELEALLSRKDQEGERFQQKLKQMGEDINKEKKKSERTWTEMEDTLNQLKQCQREKEALEQSFQHSKELLEIKYNNKIVMMEKKCQYLNKMCEYSSENKEGGMKELQSQFEQLLEEHEKLTVSYQGLEATLAEKEKIFSQAKEKIRQMEDLLNAEHKKKTGTIQNANGKNSEKRRLLLLEKCIDEILLEVGVQGIAPSKLNPREKAVVIVKKVHEISEDIKAATVARESLQNEINKLKEEVQKKHDKEAELQAQQLAQAEQVPSVLKSSEDGNLSQLDTFCSSIFQIIAEFVPQNSALLNKVKSNLESIQFWAAERSVDSQATQSATEEKQNLLEELELYKQKFLKAKSACSAYKKLLRQFTELGQEESQEKSSELSTPEKPEEMIPRMERVEERSSPVESPEPQEPKKVSLTLKPRSKTPTPDSKPSSYAAMFKKQTKKK